MCMYSYNFYSFLSAIAIYNVVFNLLNVKQKFRKIHEIYLINAKPYYTKMYMGFRERFFVLLIVLLDVV